MAKENNQGVGKRGAKDKGNIFDGGFEKRSIVRIQDFERIFASIGFRFRKNQVTSGIEVISSYDDSIVDMSDVVLSKIRAMTHELDDDKHSTDLSSPLRIHDAVNVISEKNSYHPIKQYLKHCHEFYETQAGLEQWHHDYWIDRLVASFSTDNPKITKVFIKKWLMGTARRVFHEHQNYTLVLKGPQGIGKSYFAEWLCSGPKQMFGLNVNRYFQEGSIDPENKDHISRLATRWIWAVDELGASIKKSEVNALKQFLTLSEIQIRRPYDKYDTVSQRLCSIIASSNEDEFLNDTTGNRRYLVLDLKGIDRAYSKTPESADFGRHIEAYVDVHFLWGEVMASLERGENAFLDGEELEWQVEANTASEMKDPIEDWMDNHLVIGHGFISTENLLGLLLEDKLIYSINPYTSRQVASLLKKKGAEITRGGTFNGVRPRGYKVTFRK